VSGKVEIRFYAIKWRSAINFLEIPLFSEKRKRNYKIRRWDKERI
jgi:hypothetical protein